MEVGPSSLESHPTHRAWSTPRDQLLSPSFSSPASHRNSVLPQQSELKRGETLQQGQPHTEVPIPRVRAGPDTHIYWLSSSAGFTCLSGFSIFPPRRRPTCIVCVRRASPVVDGRRVGDFRTWKPHVRRFICFCESDGSTSRILCYYVLLLPIPVVYAGKTHLTHLLFRMCLLLALLAF